MRFILLTFLIFLSKISLGQKAEDIVLLGRFKENKVWLRWAPTSVPIWLHGIKHGYKLERISLNEDGSAIAGSRINLTPQAIKPFSPEEFERKQEEDDVYSALQELIYTIENNNSKNFSALIERNQALENRMGMCLLLADLNVKGALAAGLLFIDSTAKNNQKYVYQVKTSLDGKDFSSSIVITTNKVETLIPIKEVKAQFEDKKVTIEWSAVLTRGLYSAYNIERSEDGKNYSKINELPYIQVTDKLISDKVYFLDTLVQNDKKYFYRVNGITPFAETGPNSNVVEGICRSSLAGTLLIEQSKIMPEKKAFVQWQFPQELENQIDGFQIKIAPSTNQNFVNALKRKIDKKVRSLEFNVSYNNTYVYVEAIDKNGNKLVQSFPALLQIPDETPPSAPIGLKGEISKEGKVTITWDNNTESDLLGYRIFYANKLNEEFIEARDSITVTNTFIDSVAIHVLNKKIYYKVIAIDKSFNPSEYSKPLALSKPDFIPPAAAVFTQIVAEDLSIHVNWINSASTDVASYELYRKTQAQPYDKIKQWSTLENINSFIDKGLVPGKMYQYLMIVKDSSNNQSESISRKLFLEPGYREMISDLKFSLNRESNEITLTWKNNNVSKRCHIFRKVNDKDFILFTTVEGNVEKFIDTLIEPNNKYYYKIQLIHDKAIRSILSKEIVVEF